MLAQRHDRSLIATLLALAVAALLAGPVLGKEGVMATLDAPIARDTPAGTTLLVGFTAWVDDQGRRAPVQGTPFYLKLTGGAGSQTRAASAAESEVGHYTVQILVPGGGITGVEIGIHGTTDLPITVSGTPIVAGAPGPATAAVVPVVAPSAPAAAAAGTIAPVVPAAAAEPGTVAPSAATAGGPSPAIVVVGALLALVAIALVAAAPIRRRVGLHLRRPAPGG